MNRWLKIIILIEALSLVSFWLGGRAADWLFLVVVLAVLVATIIDLRYGLTAAFLELLIGGQGYLFVLPAGGLNLSIRQAIFIIVMSVGLWRVWQEKKLAFRHSRFFGSYLWLGLAIALGIAQGFGRGRDWATVFFDANAWFFLGYLLVGYSLLLTKNNPEKLEERSAGGLISLFSSAVAWLSLKTLAVFYLFSHQFPTITPWLYKWIRDTRVGEITPALGGFYRIFFQSHIYLVLWLILAAAFFIYKLKREPPWRKLVPPAVIFALALAAIILSFSRSFWLGLILALTALLVTAWVYLRFSLKEIVWTALHLAVLAVIGFSLVGFLSYFPYPARGNFSLANLLKERASSLSDAAASSRWQLLPPLWSEVKKHWFLGAGFGASVTYQSSDPRVLAVSRDGWRTTSAFEWGWLDIWLKIGLVGVVAYLFLLKKIWQRGWQLIKTERARPWLPLGLNFTLLALIIIHFFTPYLNHPLGLGWLMLVSVIFDHQAKLTPTKSL